MKTDAVNSSLKWGILSGLLLAFGITSGITAYIDGPGRMPVRTIGVSQGDAPLTPWPDPNAGMQYPQDRLVLAELIQKQDAENATQRGNGVAASASDTITTEGAASLPPETFEIEFRNPNPKPPADDDSQIR